MTIVMMIFGLAFVVLITLCAIDPETMFHKILLFDGEGMKELSVKAKDDISYMWNNDGGPGEVYRDWKEEDGASTIKAVLLTICHYTIDALVFEITVMYHSVPEIIVKTIILCISAFIVYKVFWPLKILTVIVTYVGLAIFG